jgi:hypothetical protein
MKASAFAQTIFFHQEVYMPAPVYLLDKIARHGSAVRRLQDELRAGSGEFAEPDAMHAIAFDAADLVWVFLSLQAGEEAQDSRFVRNSIAGRIIDVLHDLPWLDANNRS